MTTDTLKIPKHAVNVEIRDICGHQRMLDVFVADPSASDDPGERLQDLFVKRRFVPARFQGELEFMSTRHLLWARVELFSALDELDLDTEGAEYPVRARVIVCLEDDSRIEGELRYLMPEGYQRVGDVIEALPTLFLLRTNDWIYLVNREHSVRIVPCGGK